MTRTIPRLLPLLAVLLSKCSTESCLCQDSGFSLTILGAGAASITLVAATGVCTSSFDTTCAAREGGCVNPPYRATDRVNLYFDATLEGTCSVHVVLTSGQVIDQTVQLHPITSSSDGCCVGMEYATGTVYLGDAYGDSGVSDGSVGDASASP